MKFVLMFSAVLLGSCSAVYRTHPTFESDPPELGGEGLIYQNELSAAYVREEDRAGLCKSTRPSYQESRKWNYQRHAEQGKSTEDKFRCLQFAPIDPGAKGTAQIARHMSAGFALSDLYCRNYFSRIALHSRQRGFARTSSNDVGTAISGILGLASAGVKATSGVGVGFGLADGFFRNYDESFLVGPDLAIVKSAVLSEQDSIKKTTVGNLPTSYADANMVIKRHADACSYVGMKQLLNQKVTNSPTDSKAALIDYIANFQISQAEIEKRVAERKKADDEQKTKEEEARKLAEQERVREAAEPIPQPAPSESPPVNP